MRTYVRYKSNHNVVYACKYHVVWCPRYRWPVLMNSVDSHLKEILHQTATELQAGIIELEVMPDHVHLLCEVDPQFGIHRLVKRLNGCSSRWLRQEFSWLESCLPTLRTHSYFAATVGGAPLAVIKPYGEHQRGR